MTTLHARRALLPDGWRDNVRLTHDAGRIISVAPDTPAEPGDDCHDTLVPGMANLVQRMQQPSLAEEPRSVGADAAPIDPTRDIQAQMHAVRSAWLQRMQQPSSNG